MQPNNENAPGSSNPNDTPSAKDLLDYLGIIFKHRRMIFRITLATTIISVVYALFLPNIYTAKTLILPAQEDKGLMSAMMNQLGGLATLTAGMGTHFGGPNSTNLYVSMLESEAVKDPVIDRFRLMEKYGKKFRTDTYKVLDKNTSVSAGRKDGIITIAVSNRDPKLAAAMANAYVEELGRLVVRLNVAGAAQNRSFLEERLSTVKADLAKAEENLKNFQAKNKAVQITAQAEATIKGVAELRAQLADQEVRLATYRRRFTDSSQEVKNLATSVSNLKEQIAKLEGTGEDSALPSVGSVPSIGQEYVRLMREFKIQESLVELLTKQYEMAKFSEVKEIPPFQVILQARVPERKSKPFRSKMVLMNALTAFFLSLVGVFLWDKFEMMPESDKMRWREKIQQLKDFRKH